MVDAVNGVEKRGTNYTPYVTAALTGAAGAGATYYFANPFLKNGVPTDEFVKQMDDKIVEMMPKEVQENLFAQKNNIKEMFSKMEKATTINEFKNVYLDNALSKITEEQIPLLKEAVENNEGLYKQFGMNPGSKDAIERFKKINSLEELKKFASENFDSFYKGKTLDEIKQAFKAEADMYNRKAAQTIFEQYWDAGKKTFVNCEEGVGAAVKKAANNIKGKYAIIVGLGVAALTAVTSLLVSDKS